MRNSCADGSLVPRDCANQLVSNTHNPLTRVAPWPPFPPPPSAPQFIFFTLLLVWVALLEGAQVSIVGLSTVDIETFKADVDGGPGSSAPSTRRIAAEGDERNAGGVESAGWGGSLSFPPEAPKGIGFRSSEAIGSRSTSSVGGIMRVKEMGCLIFLFF